MLKATKARNLFSPDFRKFQTIILLVISFIIFLYASSQLSGSGSLLMAAIEKNVGSSAKSCRKCKIPRQAYVTDNDPITLKKYMTCDRCRERNKTYKKNQKEKLFQKMKDITSLGSDDAYIATYPAGKKSEAHPKGLTSDFEAYLERVSQAKDIHSFKYSTELSHILFPNIDAELLSLFDAADMTKAQNDRLLFFKETLKRKLKCHYINRMADILLDKQIFFKTRSTNWKSTRFYCQMSCECDVIAYYKKHVAHRNPTSSQSQSMSQSSSRSQSQTQSQSQGFLASDDSMVRERSPSPSIAYPKDRNYYLCDSKLNFSFDVITRRFAVELNHLDHASLEHTNPSNSKSILHPMNSSETVAREWFTALQIQRMGESSSIIGDITSTMGNTTSMIGDTTSMIGDATSVIEDATSLIKDTSSVIDNTTSNSV